MCMMSTIVTIRGTLDVSLRIYANSVPAQGPSSTG